MSELKPGVAPLETPEPTCKSQYHRPTSLYDALRRAESLEIKLGKAQEEIKGLIGAAKGPPA